LKRRGERTKGRRGRSGEGGEGRKGFEGLAPPPRENAVYAPANIQYYYPV